MEWNDPLDLVVITVAEITNRSHPILVVTHDEGHGGWQCLDGADIGQRRSVVVSKDEILSIDPTLIEISDLPVRWRAVRNNPQAAWKREPNPDAD